MKSVSITAFRLIPDPNHLLVVAYADTPRYRSVGDQGMFSDGEILELLERLGVDLTDAAEYLENTLSAPKRVRISLQLNDEQFEYLQIQFPEVDA
jgi:hypothetical protein